MTSLTFRHATPMCETSNRLQILHQTLLNNKVSGETSPVTVTYTHNIETIVKVEIIIWLSCLKIVHLLKLHVGGFEMVIVARCGKEWKHLFCGIQMLMPILLTIFFQKTSQEAFEIGN